MLFNGERSIPQPTIRDCILDELDILKMTVEARNKKDDVFRKFAFVMFVVLIVIVLVK